MSSATLSSLNTNDNAAEMGGAFLAADNHGNALWQFGEKVANRFQNEDGEIFWTDDVTGWNYDPETDCIPA